MQDVIVYDRQGAPLLTAANLSVGVNPLTLLKTKVSLTHLRLTGFTLNIVRSTPQSETNLQELLNALSQLNSGGDQRNLSLNINTIALKLGNINYDIENQPTTTHFAPAHVHITDFNGLLNVKQLSNARINATVKKLSFREASGLSVKRLSATVVADVDSVRAENISLTLPCSDVHISTVCVNTGNPETPIYAKLLPSHISPSDFTFMLPELYKLTDAVEIAAVVKGGVNALIIDSLSLRYTDALQLTASMNINNLTDANRELYIDLGVKELSAAAAGVQTVYSTFTGTSLPEAFTRLDALVFSGYVSGYVSRLRANGTLSSSLGALAIELTSETPRSKDTLTLVKGTLTANELKPGKLFDNAVALGEASVHADVSFVQRRDTTISAQLNALVPAVEFNNYKYTNINLSGKYDNERFEAATVINDPAVSLTAKGKYIDGEITLLADVKGLRPDLLQMTKRYATPHLSFFLAAQVALPTRDFVNGVVSVHNLAFKTETDSFKIADLRLEAATAEDVNHLKITSDIVNGELNGTVHFSSIVPELMHAFAQYLPTPAAHIRTASSVNEFKNDFNYSLTVGNTERLSSTLLLPFVASATATVAGSFNSDEITAALNFPSFSFKGNHCENGFLRIDNSSDNLNLNMSVTHVNKNELRNSVKLQSTAANDSIVTRTHWTNDRSERYETLLTVSALFVDDVDENGQKKLRTEITIPSSQALLMDSVWTVEPSSITVTEGEIAVDNFYFTNGKRFLHLNGSISDNPGKTLTLSLNDIELAYIFELLNIPALQFGGAATGVLTARDMYGSMILEGALDVQCFAFNNAEQGRLKISGEWDSDRQGILLLGSIYKNDSIFSDVHGYIFPVGKEQGLNLHFAANQINVAFLQRYMKAFADEVGGLGFGDVHVYGSFSDVFVEGKPYIQDAHIKINTLNTAYSFSDTVFLNEFSINTKNTLFTDRDGNVGRIDFNLNHRNFRDLEYAFDVNTPKSLVYDIPESVNSKIFGQVYAGGTASVHGDEEQITVEGDVRSERGTAVGFNFLKQTGVADYDFITFVPQSQFVAATLSADSVAATSAATTRDSTAAAVNNNNASVGGNAMDYRLNFNIAVTPEAQLELVIDPIENARIKGNGAGNLQLSYGSNNNLQMFGNYDIREGVYNFSFQQVLHRRFNLRDGSSVMFLGDPMEAILAIDATYNLSANIQDLDESLIIETANPSVPVNCVMKLNGRLQNPTISFDIELPNSNSELERQVKSFIDTEDMMTRQIIYLLVLSKFYTPDYSRNLYTGDEFSAMASSALSAQLSSILSSLSDKVQVGANIRSRQDGIKDTEVEMLLSSQLLNNRLLFNGNFGYKDNFIQSNAFVGEFDLEYKLTRAGEISLKAYNHANDLYRYNTKSLTRQGVGLSFRKDFSTLGEFFQRRSK
jgi:hypothetical protein